ncbi:MAG: AAA family ATPase, partial [Oscillospiraceae bacterium]
HPDIFNLLLQILEDGILTDSQGRQVSFKNSVIIMTSNIGARLITEKQKTLGFSSENEKEKSNEEIKNAVLTELKKSFKPEFLNRIDEVVVFNKLTSEDIEKIAEKILGELSKRLNSLEIEFDFSKNAIKKIAEVGFDEIYGARPLRRAITSKIEDPLSEKILESEIKAPCKVYLDINQDNEFTFEKK